MMVWLVERRTLLIWRMVQFWTFLSILILEIVQLSRYQEYYWRYPANNQVRIWFSEGISFSLIGYMLFKINSRWEDGSFKQDIVLDWILFVIWIFQSFLNISPVFSGKGLDCKLGSTNPYMITTPDNQTRCRLFLVSTGFSFFALFTTFVTLILSIVRWKIRRDTKSSKSSTYHGTYNKPYLVQKGSLSNGEPVLFFYSKSKNGASYSPHLKNMSKSSVQPSVNISIPEPEIVATSKYTRDYTTNVLDNEKGETDDSVLKY